MPVPTKLEIPTDISGFADIDEIGDHTITNGGLAIGFHACEMFWCLLLQFFGKSTMTDEGSANIR